jgi:hypothetical protein
VTNRAASEVVAIAWLLGVPGLTADADHIGVTVPQRDPATSLYPWADTGFVQMVGVIGGTPGMYVPSRQPVVSLNLWAVNPDSGLPPWGRARELGELIVADTYRTTGREGGGRDVSALMPAGYAGAYVQAAWVVSEPRRVPGDAGAYARLSMDMAFAWVEL